MSKKDVRLGQITIRYSIDKNGTPVIATSFPDTDDVSIAMQLAMLEFARIDLTRVMLDGSV